jgi:HD-GYP domain-containing protein (c-di-GMP phosphodiesterase class II)
LAVADIFEALTAARPYRQGLPVEKVCEMMTADANSLICGESYGAMIAWLDRESFSTRVSSQLDAIETLVSQL